MRKVVLSVWSACFSFCYVGLEAWYCVIRPVLLCSMFNHILQDLGGAAVEAGVIICDVLASEDSPGLIGPLSSSDEESHDVGDAGSIASSTFEEDKEDAVMSANAAIAVARCLATKLSDAKSVFDGHSNEAVSHDSDSVEGHVEFADAALQDFNFTSVATPHMPDPVLEVNSELLEQQPLIDCLAPGDGHDLFRSVAPQTGEGSDGSTDMDQRDLLYKVRTVLNLTESVCICVCIVNT